MNITRYKWPVIVAAGLHGALFLPFSSDWVPPRVDKTETKSLKHIPKEIEVSIPEEVEVAATAGGGADPLPTTPEPPLAPTIDNPFEMPVTDRAVPDKPVLTLADHRLDGVPGPGDTMSFAPPSVVTPGHLDRPPRAMAQPAPRYPNSLRSEHTEGEVTVEFVVGTDGQVLTAEAVRSTHREFSAAAVEAVLRWKFEPGTVNGKKVRFRMAIPIQFNVAS